MLAPLFSLQQGNFKQSEKLMKIVNIEERTSYLLNEYRNLNEIFRKDVTYDNIKSHTKTGLQSFSEKTHFWKNHSGEG